MKVKLVAHTPNPEETVTAAAKLCYSAVGVETLMADLTAESTEKFVNKIADLGHFSPFEHVSFTFAVEGVSRVLTHQLVRHRLASYSQQSQRYVKLAQFEYIIPPAIEQNAKAKEIFVNAMVEDQKTYNTLVNELEKDYFHKYVEAGLTEKQAKSKAEKTAIEDARFVFPNACETKIVVTMNARSLMHFFNHRCCNRAQWEIRVLADEMLKIAKEIAPSIFKRSGPPCLTEKCPEGVMTCGEMTSVRSKYQSL